MSGRLREPLARSSPFEADLRSALAVLCAAHARLMRLLRSMVVLQLVLPLLVVDVSTDGELSELAAVLMMVVEGD